MCSTCKQHLDSVKKSSSLINTDLSFLETPQRSLTVTFPVLLDTGETKMIRGYRVQYNDALGPTKGGIRIHQDADREEVSELAFLMSLKTSLAGLPYGGAKGAIQINPKDYSATDLEKIIRRFTREISHHIGEDYDIPAPDVNTDPETMRIMLDEYERVIGKKSSATFTGKPVQSGGSLGRDTSTSKGGYYILREHLGDRDPNDITVAIQGYGNVGSHLAELLHTDGFKVVAVSDSSTALYNSQGPPAPELSEWKNEGKRFSDRSEEKISNEELLELSVDILAPSALGGVIANNNANNIRAPLIIEMANGPVTPEADDILQKKNVTVLPDILANAGGVIVSYFEWVQNKENVQWVADDVDTKLKEMILSAYEAVMKESRAENVNIRTASYILAIKRILEREAKRK